MIFYETLFTFASLLLVFPIGKIFNPKSHAITQLFFGIMISGILLSILGRFAPMYAREFLYIFSIGALVLMIKKELLLHKSNTSPLKNLISNIKLNEIFTFLFIWLLTSLMLINFSINNILIESHDIHIFAPIIEIFNSNYIGNVKNPIMYPYELSSYHLLPGAIQGVLNFVNPNITLVSLLNSKYLFVTFFLSFGIYKLLKYFKFSVLSIISLAVLILFYKETIIYNFSISNYLYQLTLIILFHSFIQLLKHDANNGDGGYEFVAILIFLIQIKIPIFYLPLASLAYIFLMKPKVILDKKIVFLFAITFLHLISIIIIPRSTSIQQIVEYSLINPFKFSDLTSMGSIWFVETRMMEIFLVIFDSFKINAFLLDQRVNEFIFKIIYIGIFFIGIFFLSISSFQTTIWKRALYIFFISALFGLIFVRNGGNLDQQSHIYLNLIILGLFFFHFHLNQNLYKSYKLNFTNTILLSMIIFSLSDLKNFYDPFSNLGSISYRGEESASLDSIELISPMPGKRFLISENQFFWKIAIESQVQGKHIYLEDLENFNIDYSDYHLANYVVE